MSQTTRVRKLIRAHFHAVGRIAQAPKSGSAAYDQGWRAPTGRRAGAAAPAGDRASRDAPTEAIEARDALVGER